MGKPRLKRFYKPPLVDDQQLVIRESSQLIIKRPDRGCNFRGGETFNDKNTKIFYRHYATLFFIFIVDASESELGILDLIQVFVETLDKCFENVCELDLIFHMDRIHFILDEIVMGGMVLETNLQDIQEAIDAQNKIVKAENPLSGMKDVLHRIQR
eukprot:TRINITY_DN3367_c0_g1_i3.p2 TRINITY_DN3367_c0_g1~~TRINITY_DN3367_c0_g1_i3.p2  ORF type:complete len:165 (+),score=36.76 TRINITY_DN3367_c0_g1_i3:29-496(+)